MSLVQLPPVSTEEVENARRRLEEAIDDIVPEKEAVLEKFDEIVNNFNNSTWRHFRRIRAGRMRDAIETIRTHLETVVDENIGTVVAVAEHVIRRRTPVVSLFLTSLDWLSDTMNPTSEVENRIPPGADNNSFARLQWDDSAQRVYDSRIIGGQQGATEAIKKLAKVMSRWLAEIGEENVGYVTFLLNQLTEIVATLAAAAAAVVTSAGVFTLQQLAELVGDLVKATMTTLAEIGNRVSSAVGRIIDAENELADNAAFPEGNWPIAVARA